MEVSLPKDNLFRFNSVTAGGRFPRRRGDRRREEGLDSSSGLPAKEAAKPTREDKDRENIRRQLALEKVKLDFILLLISVTIYTPNWVWILKEDLQICFVNEIASDDEVLEDDDINVRYKLLFFYCTKEC